MRRQWIRAMPLLISASVFVCLIFLVQVIEAQEQTSKTSKLSYSRLYEKPRQLFDHWAEQQNKIQKQKISPAERYNSLTPSQRTTYEAVTHALYFSKLTDSSGKPMGSALDLVSELEDIAGEVEGKRGDVQYRLYVKMVPNAENALMKCQEFKRDKDNTVFHKEYPLNFRQRGKYPSIQFSMTRSADRADIDVDYRSSKPPQALFNGHLTAGNSDVRAGNNYSGHLSHWKGLINWWRGLFKQKQPAASTKTVTVTDVVEPDLSDEVVIENLTDAAQEFFNDWLVRRNVKSALKFYSPNADVCLNTDDDAENEDLSGKDARQLFVEVLETANVALGKQRDLSQTIVAVEPWDTELKVMDHPNQSFFTMVSVSDAEADEFLCRSQTPLEPTKDTPPPKYGTYYETLFTFKYPKGQNDGGMILLWEKENGKWQILSYDDLEM
jgi:hypothetical protein